MSNPIGRIDLLLSGLATRFLESQCTPKEVEALRPIIDRAAAKIAPAAGTGMRIFREAMKLAAESEIKPK